MQSEAERKAKRDVYLKANVEKIKAKRKAYRERCKEREAAAKKAWHEANKDRFRDTQKAWNEANRANRLASSRSFYARNKDKIAQRARGYRRKGKYGLSPEAFAGLLQSQDNRCKCCQTPFGLLKGLQPCVDHCHRTGVVRGILCQRCNQLLGHATDSPKILRTCAAYLERRQAAVG